MRKRMDISNLLLATILTMLLILAVACGGGGGGGNGGHKPNSPPSGGNANTEDYGVIMGKIQDPAGNVIGEVTVSAAGKTTVSNEQGFFSLSEIEESDRVVVNFTKQGYVGNTQVTKVRTGQSAFLNATLPPIEKTVDFFSGNGVSHGETYTQTGASVDIGPDSLVDSAGNPFNGMARVMISPFDPSTEEGKKCFPGEFKGETTSGETVFLESFGFMDVTITDTSGNELQIAPGRNAEIAIPVPSSLNAWAPNTIPLWYFDSSDGKWHEDGSAVLNGSGTSFEGTVTHFTPWNADQLWPPGVMAWVQGIVIDPATGLPVNGARLVITGRNWTSGDTAVDPDGKFIIPVMPNQSATLIASKGQVESETYNIFTNGTGEVTEVGTIYLGGRPKITINLTWGENPADLDAHLTIPSHGYWEHLYFGTPGLAIAGAELSTDDTTSLGPEIITVYELQNGVYRYSVHHYSGSGTLSSSEADLLMVVDGVGVFHLDPPAGALGSKDAWRGWDITVSGGKVVNVTEVNNYLNDANASDITDFIP